MRAWVVAVAMGLLAGSARAGAGAPIDPGDAVVLLHQGSSACAGAFVDGGGRVVTAYHCVADGGRVRVQTRDGRTATGRVVSRAPRQDLAVVEVRALAGEPSLTLRAEPVVLGERIHAWGHPLASLAPGGFLLGTLRWSVTDGTVAAVGATALQITAPVNPGNSGGPVVDEAGRLVGVVSRRLRGDGLGFATRADAVASLLEEPRRGGLVGGSVRVELVASGWGGDAGVLAFGARAEVAVRDRVVLAVAAASPFQPDFTALRFGEVSWSLGEGTLGLRQRLGFGYWTSRVDVYGGVAVIERRVGDRDRFGVAFQDRATPLVGMRLGVASVVLDVGVVPAGAGTFEEPGEAPDKAPVVRTSLSLRWPGRITVF